MSVIETAANTDPLGPMTLRKAAVSWTELESLQQQHTLSSPSQDEADEEGGVGEDGQDNAGGGRIPAITGPASFAAAIQERFAALMPQEADGTRRKLFSGMSAPELRFTFGSDDEGDGTGVADKIVAGFEDFGEGIRNTGEKVGEGIRNAGEKVAGGISKSFGAVKSVITSIGNRDKSPSRGAESGDDGEDGDGGHAAATKPKMINPFKAAGAVVGKAAGAMVRAVSPHRAGGGGDEEKGATPEKGGEKSKIMARLSNVFTK